MSLEANDDKAAPSSDKGDSTPPPTMSLPDLRRQLTYHADFPKPGVLFVNIMPWFRDWRCVDALIAHSLERIRQCFPNTQALAGLEARGFLLGPMLAHRLHLPFVPIRKRGKLPGCCHSIEYEKEYGSDFIEIEADAMPAGTRCLLIDDLLATGGTLRGAIDLVVGKAGAECVGALVAVELRALGGRDRLPSGVKCVALIEE